MKRVLEHALFADSLRFRIMRIVSVAGIVIGAIGLIDRSFPRALPRGNVGMVLFALLVLCLNLSIELLNAQRALRASPTRPVGDARAEFAASVLAYANSLAAASPPRDKVLLELRRWSSRLLHLNGCHQERAEIGRLALGAAAALNDRFTEASILVDDLGWCLHAQGKSVEASKSIREGIGLIEGMPVEERERPDVIELLIKARRHMLSIEYSQNHDIDAALRATKEVEQIVDRLPEPSKAHHLAQLKHTLGALVHQHLDTVVGPSSPLDPSGRLFALHRDAVVASQAAEEAFGELGDVERQVKALKIHVELLRHGTNEPRLHRAESRLRRLETTVSRKLS